MDRMTALERLKASEAELRAMGVMSLSLFGSLARGDQRADSDIDLAATFDPAKRVGMFRFAAIEGRLRDVLGGPVDLVGEPARHARMQSEIDRDRVRAF